MMEKEIGELYVRLAFQYEFSIDSLLARRIIDIDIDLAATSREKFYDSLDQENYGHLKESKPIIYLRRTQGSRPSQPDLPEKWRIFDRSIERLGESAGNYFEEKLD